MDDNSISNEKLTESRSVWNEIYDWVDSAVITVICLVMVFAFAIKQVRIDGGSMEMTLIDGQRVLVSDIGYTPSYGDIVVISSEVYDDKPIIKRVIATGGQWVNIENGDVFVGNSVDDMKAVGREFVGGVYTDRSINPDAFKPLSYPLYVPEGKVFALGDNRTVSIDSRFAAIGLIDERDIIGKAVLRVYPFDKIGSIKPALSVTELNENYYY